MEIIPAIDLRGGKAVRLYQGDYAQETVFDEDPIAVARRWQEQGAPRIHIVDLDGARHGRPFQADIVAGIANAVSVPVQVGGGIRTLDQIETLLNVGVDRVVLGTVAVEEPELVQAACLRFAQAIVVGIDARDGKVAVRGWREGSSVDALELARALSEAGVPRFVHTDIARDGTLQGPNLQAMEAFVQAIAPKAVIASGGVSSVGDIKRLAATGVEGVIIGRALYTGAVSLPEALSLSF
jgi:phosphoribosylformimino-5-aminoimidazole carboxamide ribotide isomerase